MSQEGGALLTQALRAAGLDRGLSAALERWRASRAVHNPGKVVTDLAVALALGGTAWPMPRCRVRSQRLFGPVASDPAVSRPVTRLAETRRSAEGDPRCAGGGPAAGLELAGEARPGADGGWSRLILTRPL